MFLKKFSELSIFFFKKNIEFQKCTKNVPLKVLNYNHPKQLARYEHLMCSDSTSRRQSEPEFPEGHSVRHQLLWTFTILHLQYTTPVLRFFIPSQPPSVSLKNLRKIDRILIATTRAKACIFQASTELWSCFAAGIVRTNALLLGFHEPEGQVGCHQGVCQDVTGRKERFFWVVTLDDSTSLVYPSIFRISSRWFSIGLHTLKKISETPKSRSEKSRRNMENRRIH